MRVLVAWGSERGGTEGIARVLGDALRDASGDASDDVTMLEAGKVRSIDGFDAVIIGGALYANRWHARARRFVGRHERALRRVPVWFFSSGPLDVSADTKTIDPPQRVKELMERVGAQGHRTFGGRLAPDARGFIASKMAKKQAGDWRDPEVVRAWAAELARALPSARPGPVVVQPGHTWARVVTHATVGWALCAAIMALAWWAAPGGAALVVHALAAPIAFALVARHYFRAPGAREALPTAAAFTAITAALDIMLVVGLFLNSTSMFASVLGTWLPLGLIFLVTWAVGAIMSTMPWRDAPPPRAA